MYCTRCGEYLSDGDVYCSRCGVRVKPVIINNSPIEEKSTNVCAVLAIIFGSIGFVPGLNLLFLPPAIVLAIIGLATGANKKKGAVIACSIVVSLSLLFSVGWMSNCEEGYDEGEDGRGEHYHERYEY